jgi:hypothetical protein
VAYIRRKASKNGSVSTTLVETYRDDQGRPRERALANLHGESTSLDALAKLTVQIEELRTHRDELTAKADDGFVMSYVARKLAILEQERAIIAAHCHTGRRAAPRKLRADHRAAAPANALTVAEGPHWSGLRQALVR